MTENWQIRLASCLIFVGTLAVSRNYVFAQITPDRTLGDESSVVTPNESINGVESDRISGGTIRGANLFHSFKQFNIGEGRGAYFTNPTGVENILSRVTGNNPSNILGRLGVLGNANLFFINPNGIIFGENASLDVQGSFVVTTANAVGLGERGLFSATEPETSNLLEVNPSALFFNAVAAQNIVNRSQALELDGEINSPKLGLQVPTDETLALIGGDVLLAKGNLTALEGRIELGSVTGVGKVDLSQKGGEWVFGYDRVNSFGEIWIQDEVSINSGEALIDASGESGGNVQIRASELKMVGGARIFADTTGAGNGGEIVVRTSDEISLSGGSRITADVFSTGTAGDVIVKTGRLRIRDGSVIRSNSDASEGRGGNLTVTALDSIELTGTSSDKTQQASGLFTVTEEGGTGSAGNLTINTGRLVVRDGATISTSTFSEGKGGNLTVNASDFIELTGTRPNGKFPSGLFAQTTGNGNAGNLKINTGRLVVRDGAQVSASTFNAGQGGTLTVIASDVIEIEGASPNGTFPSGLFVQSINTGNSGNISVTAKTIRLDERGVIRANTNFGQGGDIELEVQDLLLLLGESRISAAGVPSQGGTSQGGTSLTAEEGAFGNGGNITIRSPFIIAIPQENSDIRADASRGRGGNITINTSGLFGIEERNTLTRLSDINASSEFGIDGIVEINAIEFDPSRETVSIPSLQTEAQIAQACQPSGNQAQSQFIVVGRGGLPTSPNEDLSSDAVHVDWITMDSPTTQEENNEEVVSTPKEDRIIEAQGWKRDRNGKTVLIASASETQSQDTQLPSNNCPATSSN